MDGEVRFTSAIPAAGGHEQRNDRLMFCSAKQMEIPSIDLMKEAYSECRHSPIIFSVTDIQCNEVHRKKSNINRGPSRLYVPNAHIKPGEVYLRVQNKTRQL
jgi:hypothetical protein